ncbi:uncharacterized protein LOC115620571 [Scaptodrosophila lebanonensis]|uniref:Uncharacterized protein LOC115620571 n=1 Tax=Drosophila lebanonensis TaxID=7225 RepID=A0A6J2SYS7_DROLE|nr:uncharacterized protein LOC115620571 [Scaptodrosophila lebanonensis]
MLRTIRLQLRKIRSAKNESGLSPELPRMETPGISKKNRAQHLLQCLHMLLFYFVVLVLSPLLIFSALKLFVFQWIFGISNTDLNADIGSAVGTVIAMHVGLTAYIFRLIAMQEFSKMEKQETLAEWKGLNSQDLGAASVVLLLMFYCVLICIFPIFTFFILKFIVLENVFLVTGIDADIISAIGAVVAVHAALAVYIYRAYYGAAHRLFKTK